MRTKRLTKTQQDWLNHIEQATKHKLSMSAYAKQNNLVLKAFYNALTALRKKGLLPPITNNPLIPITVTSATMPKATTSWRITLCNGVLVELADVDIASLLNCASQL